MDLPRNEAGPHYAIPEPIRPGWHRKQQRMNSKIILPSLLFSVFVIFVPACDRNQSKSGTSQQTAVQGKARFIDRAKELNLHFIHENGARGQRFMPETTIGGGGWIDFDNDGWFDVILVNGNEDAAYGKSGKSSNRLFRFNPTTKKFEDATTAAGLGDTSYGSGLAVGDFDNDGFSDLYITNLTSNVLYRNLGNGKFENVTEKAGVEAVGWSASAAFLDYDQDGLLDLYVCQYVAYDPKVVCKLSDGTVGYCSPGVFPGIPDKLFRNLGDGTFKDVSREAGIEVAGPQAGKSLGVIVSDLDGDGDSDIYVACDQVPNLYFQNQGDGTFKEKGLLSNLAYSSSGESQAGMGIDVGDFNSDGNMDLIVTNFSNETNALYQNLGSIFQEVGSKFGVAGVTLSPLGFGVVFIDHDFDGDLDLYIGNGHVSDIVSKTNPGMTFKQSDLLLDQQAGFKFVDISKQSGDWFQKKTLSRSVAPADFDKDGDEDLLIVNCGGEVSLLENVLKAKGHYLALRLEGTKSNRDAYGAKVKLTFKRDGKEYTRIQECRSARSYLAAGDPTIRFGLGKGAIELIQVEIRWPTGAVQILKELKIDTVQKVVEQDY